MHFPPPPSFFQACSKESQSLKTIKPNRSRCASGKSFPGTGHCSCTFGKPELAPFDAPQQIHVVKSYVLQIVVWADPLVNVCSTLNSCTSKKIKIVSINQTQFVLRKKNFEEGTLSRLLALALALGRTTATFIMASLSLLSQSLRINTP